MLISSLKQIVILLAVLPATPCCLKSHCQRRYELMRVESETVPDKVFNLKRLKVKQWANVINGTLELLQDVDASSKLSLRLFYSRYGNLDFKLTPINYEKSMCEFLNTDYKTYLMEDLKKISDLPVVGDEYFCPLKAGKYQITNLAWNTSIIPPYLANGFYKFEGRLILGNGDKSITTLQFILHDNYGEGISY